MSDVLKTSFLLVRAVEASPAVLMEVPSRTNPTLNLPFTVLSLSARELVKQADAICYPGPLLDKVSLAA